MRDLLSGWRHHSASMAIANSGTVAPRMAVKPACSRSIEKVSRLKGSAEFSTPSSSSPGALARSSGRIGGLSVQGMKNAAAPIMRSITSGSGPKAGTAMRVNMYDEPQIAASVRNRSRSAVATR